LILRRLAAVLLGIVIAVAIVQFAEVGVHAMNPPPPGTEMRDLAQVKAYVAALPLSALLLVLGGWLVGTLLGTWTAARVGRSAIPAFVVGAILLCAGIANAFIIPQPMWFSIASFAIYIAGTFIAVRLAALRPASPQALPPA
jgi:hypothetical protein